MAQIEDVTGTPIRAAEDVSHRLVHDILRREEHTRIQVTLNTPLVPNALPGVVEQNPPIHAYDVASGLYHQFEQARRSRTEMDCWNVQRSDGVKHARAIRQYESFVIRRAEHTDPAIEELDNLCTRGNLTSKVAHDDFGHGSHQAMPNFRSAEH